MPLTTSDPYAEIGDSFTEVDGLKVVKNEIYYHPKTAKHSAKPYPKLRVLTLSNRSVVYACAMPDCQTEGQEVSPDLDDMKYHVRYTHKAPAGSRAAARQAGTAGPTQPRSTKKAAIPADLAQMSLGELLLLGQTVVNNEQHLAQVCADRDRWKQEATAAVGRLRRIERAMSKLGFVLAVDDEDEETDG